MGKTQIALEFAHRHLRQFGIVWWLYCEDDQQFTASMRKLGDALHLTFDKDCSSEDMIRKVTNCIETQKYENWLLVADNVVDHAILKKLPQMGGCLLLTTQLVNHPVWVEVQVELRRLATKEVQSLFFLVACDNDMRALKLTCLL